MNSLGGCAPVVETFKPGGSAVEDSDRESPACEQATGGSGSCGTDLGQDFEGLDQASPPAQVHEPKLAAIKTQIDQLVKEYYSLAFPERTFEPGKSKVPCAGRVFDQEELLSAVESSLEFWLTLGHFGVEFEKEF